MTRRDGDYSSPYSPAHGPVSHVAPTEATLPPLALKSGEIVVKALASGSSGNAVLVRAGAVAVLIDAGLPGRTLAALLRQHGVAPGELAAILVSHEHSDHIAGATVLSRLYHAPVVANKATLDAVARFSRARAAHPTLVLPTGGTHHFGALSVTTTPTPHDAVESVAFSLTYEGWRMFLATDLGYDAPDLEKPISEADLIVLEANHDLETLRQGPYPWPLKNRILGKGGHLSNDQTAALLERALTRVPARRRWLWLAHLSGDNNTPRKAREQISLRLDLAGIGREVEIDIARRDVPSAVWHNSRLAYQHALF